jgi:TatA/E family protein of Tat protein translocase
MPQIGPAEILVVVLVGLLVFGPTRLPEVGRQVGRGLRELKKIQRAVKDEIDAVLDGDGVRPDSEARVHESTEVR